MKAWRNSSSGKILLFDTDATVLVDGSRPMTGALTLSGAPTSALHAATKGYVDGEIAALNADQYLTAAEGDAAYVNVAGDTMTGNLSFGSITRQMLNLYSTTYGLGVQSSTLYIRTASGFAIHRAGVHSSAAGDPGAGGTKMFEIASNGEVDIYSTSSGATLGLWSPKGTASDWLGFYNTTDSARRGWIGFGTVNGSGMTLYNDEGDITVSAPASGALVTVNAASAIPLQLAGAEVARIAAGGYLLVAKSAVDFTTVGHMLYPTGAHLSTTTAAGTYNHGAFHIGSADAGGQLFASYRRTTSGTAIGSISQVSTTGVAFNTTSDEDLKEAIDYDDFDPVDVVKRLRPRWFRWKESGEVDFGVFAQEQWKVWPQGVTVGDGDTPWAVDYGRKTTLLLATIQKLIERIEALEAA